MSSRIGRTATLALLCVCWLAFDAAAQQDPSPPQNPAPQDPSRPQNFRVSDLKEGPTPNTVSLVYE
jgi:hypothetical protein